MISVDTNVLVRIVTNDDPPQVKRAAALLAHHEIFISKTVCLEMEWVLRYAYQLRPPAILTAFHSVMGLPTVTVEDPLALGKALDWYAQGMDLADALHLSSSGHADQFATFDEKLSKISKTLSTIPVRLL